MSKWEQLWNSLRNKEYREAFAADVGTGLAFQIRLLREKAGWTQEQLASRLGKPQPQVSQWENPDYGRYSLKSLNELAAAFDVALVVRFAPFSELVEWMVNLTPGRLASPSYEEEVAQADQWPSAQAASTGSIHFFGEAGDVRLTVNRAEAATAVIIDPYAALPLKTPSRPELQDAIA